MNPPKAEIVPAPPRPVGRPTTYDPETADRFLTIYAQQASGTILDACEQAGIAWSTIRGWKDANEDFRHAFACARQDKAEIVAGSAGTVLDAVDPDSPFGNARVGKAREQGAYRRWLASKLDPATYGDTSAVKATEITVTLRGFGPAAPAKRVIDVTDSQAKPAP